MRRAQTAVGVGRVVRRVVCRVRSQGRSSIVAFQMINDNDNERLDHKYLGHRYLWTMSCNNNSILRGQKEKLGKIL